MTKAERQRLPVISSVVEQDIDTCLPHSPGTNRHSLATVRTLEGERLASLLPTSRPFEFAPHSCPEVLEVPSKHAHVLSCRPFHGRGPGLRNLTARPFSAIRSIHRDNRPHRSVGDGLDRDEVHGEEQLVLRQRTTRLLSEWFLPVYISSTCLPPRSMDIRSVKVRLGAGVPARVRSEPSAARPGD